MKKIKRRYIALQIDSDETPNSKEFIDAVWSAISKLYGEHGASLTNLTLIDYDAEKKTAVIRVALTNINMVRASLASLTSIANKKAAVHVMAVSGTMKALYKKIKYF